MRRCGSRVHGCCRCESVRVSASLGEMEVMNDPTTYHVAFHVSHARCCPKKSACRFSTFYTTLFILLLLVRVVCVCTHTLTPLEILIYTCYSTVQLYSTGTEKILLLQLHIPTTRWCAPLRYRYFRRYDTPHTRYL